MTPSSSFTGSSPDPSAPVDAKAADEQPSGQKMAINAKQTLVAGNYNAAPAERESGVSRVALFGSHRDIRR